MSNDLLDGMGLPRQDRRRSPFWSSPDADECQLPNNFETQDIVIERHICLISRLVPVNDAALNGTLGELLACVFGLRNCRKPFCPSCARDFRRWLITQHFSVVSGAGSHTRIVTAILEKVAVGCLTKVKLSQIKARLRTVLDRCGFKGAIVSGDIEAAWDAAASCWVIHAHLVVLGAPEQALIALPPPEWQTRYKNSAPARSWKTIILSPQVQHVSSSWWPVWFPSSGGNTSTSSPTC